MLEKPIIKEKIESVDELSETEKKEIDEALRAKNVFVWTPEVSNATDEEIKAGINAQQKIVSFGSRGLGYLEQKLIKDNPYEFAVFARSLAKEENLDTITNVLFKDCVTKIRDGSAASQLSDTLCRLIVDIRKNNPSDNRLKDIADKMVRVLNSVDLGLKRRNYLKTLALTGTSKARDYLNLDENIESTPYRDYLENSDSYRMYSFDNHRFKTWNDVLEHREAVRRNSQHFNNHSISSGDYERDWSDPDGYSDEFDFPDKKKDDPDDEESDNLPGYPDDYEEDGQEFGSFELDKETEETINKTKKMIFEMELGETIAPVAKLCLFNQLKNNPGQEVIDRTIRKIKKLAEIEKAYESASSLPTIGIEIECHRYAFNNKKISLLRELGVSNYEESSGSDDPLWEVNPHFSYSALVQARYLQELVKAGFIPLIYDREGNAKIPQNHLLSLHVNLGVPLTGVWDKELVKKSYILSDVFNYAFTSGNRILERKTQYSIDIKKAINSNKMKKSEEVDYKKKKEREKKKKRKNKVEWLELCDFPRLELRASEFRDYKTFLMLEGMQRIGAMFFSHFKSTDKEKMNSEEIALAKLWRHFQEEYLEIMKKHGIRRLNLVDREEHRASDLADNLELKKACQELIYKYARKVGRYINKDRERTLEKAA
jgi:hypothetical protein